MSECIVRMPYPKDCESCHLKTRNFFTGDFICAKTHTFLPASGKNNNCPILCQLPEGHGRLVDADANFLGVIHLIGGGFANYNTTIADRIGEEDMRVVKIIVPAERSET